MPTLSKNSQKRPIGRAKNRNSTDPRKLGVIKELTAALEEGGYMVRREELKRGPGWRAVSGSCRAFDRRLVLVDRLLPQDDQIAFLAAKIGELNVAVTPERAALLPVGVRGLIAPQP